MSSFVIHPGWLRQPADGIAEVQPQRVMGAADPGERLPNAVRDRFPRALETIAAVRGRPTATVAPDHGDQLRHAEPLPRVPQEVLEVAQTLRILQPHDPPAVRDRPVVAFAAKDRLLVPMIAARAV